MIRTRNTLLCFVPINLFVLVPVLFKIWSYIFEKKNYTQRNYGVDFRFFSEITETSNAH